MSVLLIWMNLLVFIITTAITTITAVTASITTIAITTLLVDNSSALFSDGFDNLNNLSVGFDDFSELLDDIFGHFLEKSGCAISRAVLLRATTSIFVLLSNFKWWGLGVISQVNGKNIIGNINTGWLVVLFRWGVHCFQIRSGLNWKGNGSSRASAIAWVTRGWSTRGWAISRSDGQTQQNWEH